MISDAHLINIAKAMAGETFSYPTSLLVGTGSVTDLDVTDDVLPGEIGLRKTLTYSRANNVLDYSAIRLSTDVVGGTSGDALLSAGIDLASTGDNLQAYFTLSELQTTAYDIQFDFIVNYRRI